jgi:hypothetical protein
LAAGGLACLACALALAGLRPVVFGRPLPMVHVTWRGVDPGERRALEARFRLSESTPVAGATWAYVPLDPTPATLGALVAHPAVEDTEGINRRTMTMARRPPLTGRRGGLWTDPPRGAAGATLLAAGLLALLGIAALVAGVGARRGVAVRDVASAVRTAPARARALAARIAIPPPLAMATLFACVAAFRFLALDFFDNDHFVSLTAARQVTLGELPVRDFHDPGLPLALALSAAALWLGGPGLLPEAALTSSMLALGAVAAWRAAARASGMASLALAATLLQVIAFPRLYSYPKILVNAAAALLFIAYARSPDRKRLFALAALAEAAFLFRYDLAVYLGLATVVLLLLVHGPGRAAAARVALYAASCAAMTLPYAAYLSAYGFADQVQSAVAFSRSEAGRTLEWGAVLSQAQPLTLVVVLLPVTACAWLAIRRWRNGRWDDGAPPVAAIAVLLAALDAGMLRDRTHARLADVFGPAPVLLAWAGARGIRAASRLRTRSGRVLAAGALTALAVVIVSDTFRLGAFPHQLGEAGLTEGWSGVSSRARRQASAFGDRRFWTGVVQDGGDLEPLVGYLDACTAPDARVLVVGFFPQLPFLAGRPFAGGHPVILPGYFTGAVDQRRMRAWLTAHPPSVVVIDPVQAPDIAGQWPALARLLKTYRAPVAVGRFVVRTSADLPADLIHPATGLPCAG